MSEAELQAPLPVGFLYDAQGQVMLDPDQQVQQSIRFLFESFRRLGSAGALSKRSARTSCCSRTGPEVDRRMGSWCGSN